MEIMPVNRFIQGHHSHSLTLSVKHISLSGGKFSNKKRMMIISRMEIFMRCRDLWEHSAMQAPFC